MCENCEQLNGVIGEAVTQLTTERERYEREREILALLVVELSRHRDAMSTVLERATSRLAGITPSGRIPA